MEYSHTVSRLGLWHLLMYNLIDEVPRHHIHTLVNKLLHVQL